MSGAPKRILVIKLGALGDIVLACGPFAAIRRTYPDAHITLLTTPAFVDFLKPSGWFDEVRTDTRPPLWRISDWLALREFLRDGAFDFVYDLQTSDRSGWYYRLMGPGTRPNWSGIAPGCSHPHANPDRDGMHSIERQREQLAMAGVDDVPDTDLSWVEADIARFNLPEKFALLVPGGAPHRTDKRWPTENYGVLARDLATRGVTPVVLGSAAESPLAAEILSATDRAVALTGQTSIADIAVLARQATGAIGNDTGPVHMIAAADCPSVVLFSNASDPTITAPRGASVTVIRHDPLSSLTVEEVAAALTLR